MEGGKASERLYLMNKYKDRDILCQRGMQAEVVIFFLYSIQSTTVDEGVFDYFSEQQQYIS